VVGLLEGDPELTFAVDSGVVCLVGGRGLVALDQRTGDHRWHRLADLSYGAKPVAAGATIYAGRDEDGDGGVRRWELADGTEQPMLGPQAAAIQLNLAGNTLYVTTANAVHSVALPAP
jgi:outer membrane protein assembly factor BamB